MITSNRLHIYTHGSHETGIGHIMRCIALAEYAAQNNIDTIFISSDAITQQMLRNYGMQTLPNTLDIPRWIIRDFSNDNNRDKVRTEIALGSKVLLLDDKGVARCEATMVVDAMMTSSRAKILPRGDKTEYLYGLKHTPLRTDIAELCGMARPGNGQHLLIALGYGFDDEFVLAYLSALHKNGFCCDCDILLPDSLVQIDQFKLVAMKLNAVIHINETSIAPLFKKADLVITKLGMTQLEAFAVGVGCLAIEPSMAHLDVQNDLTKSNSHWPVMELGLASELHPDDAAERTLDLLVDSKRLELFGISARKVVDGGGTERVLQRFLR